MMMLEILLMEVAHRHQGARTVDKYARYDAEICYPFVCNNENQNINNFRQPTEAKDIRVYSQFIDNHEELCVHTGRGCPIYDTKKLNNMLGALLYHAIHRKVNRHTYIDGGQKHNNICDVVFV